MMDERYYCAFFLAFTGHSNSDMESVRAGYSGDQTDAVEQHRSNEINSRTMTHYLLSSSFLSIFWRHKFSLKTSFVSLNFIGFNFTLDMISS
jgi:hypothetical protein